MQVLWVTLGLLAVTAGVFSDEEGHAHHKGCKGPKGRHMEMFRTCSAEFTGDADVATEEIKKVYRGEITSPDEIQQEDTRCFYRCIMRQTGVLSVDDAWAPENWRGKMRRHNFTISADLKEKLTPCFPKEGEKINDCAEAAKAHVCAWQEILKFKKSQGEANP